MIIKKKWIEKFKQVAEKGDFTTKHRTIITCLLRVT